MLGHQLVVLCDAHLGASGPGVQSALLDFLPTVPELGDGLLINGDLFDFWFEYGRVVPRTGFHVVAALAALRRRVPVIMVGGNHDRWGGDFWRSDLDIPFHPLETRLTIGHRQVLAIHGDGLTEEHWSATLMYHLTRNPAMIALYRALHPAVGFWLADRLSHKLGNDTRDPAQIAQVAARQRAWAERRLAAEPELGLVVMGHTHHPALTEPRPGGQYLNPGAWLDGFRYAIATESGAELRRYGEP